MKDDSENHLKAPLFSLVQWLSIIRLLRVTGQGSTNLVKIPGIFLRDAFHAVGMWEGDIWVAYIEELEIWTRQKSMLQGSMQKKY